jgi:hypothetical protein
MNEKPQRLRVNGHAVMGRWAGSQLLVRVTPTDVFPNCPRYIPNLPAGEPSQYIPCAGAPPKEPAWKNFDDLKDVVPPRRA